MLYCRAKQCTMLMLFHILFWINNCLIFICCIVFNMLKLHFFSKYIIRCLGYWKGFFPKCSLVIVRWFIISFWILGAFPFRPSLFTLLESRMIILELSSPAPYWNPYFLYTMCSTFVVYFIVLLDHISCKLYKKEFVRGSVWSLYMSRNVSILLTWSIIWLGVQS